MDKMIEAMNGYISKIAGWNNGQWECDGAHGCGAVKSLDDVMNKLDDSDVNVRLLVIKAIDAAVPYLDRESLGYIKSGLFKKLGDKSQNTYSGIWQSEEDEFVVVSEIAYETLSNLSRNKNFEFRFWKSGYCCDFDAENTDYSKLDITSVNAQDAYDIGIAHCNGILKGGVLDGVVIDKIFVDGVYFEDKFVYGGGKK